ncbi:MAG: tetratricopeptide repeat protein [Pseudobdellovibrionaceae bacterium]
MKLTSHILSLILVASPLAAMGQNKAPAKRQQAKASQKKAPPSGVAIAPPLPSKSGAVAKAPPLPRKAVVAGARDWEAARKLFQAGNYKQSAVSFYQISKRSPDMKLRRKAKFYLGVSLYKMGLRQVASFPFVDLVRTGEGIEKQKGLDYVVMIADELGEPSLLNYSLNHIRPENLSDVSRVVFLGRLGEAALAKGDIAGAESYFEKALEYKKNENGLLYSLGLTDLMSKRPDKAATRFGQLVERTDNRAWPDLHKGLATLGLARSLYQGKKWNDAAEIYRQIPKDHPLYRQSLMELSWSLFRGGQFRSALSPLQTLHTPFYENFYDPESLLLHGTILLFICHYDEIESIIRSFDKNYYPAFSKIQEWLGSNRSEADYYLEVAKSRRALMELKAKGKATIDTNLPFFVMRTLLEDPDIRILAEYMDKIAREKKILEKVYGKTSLLAYGNQILEGRKRAAQKQIGSLIRNRLISKVQEFNEFATQFEFLKYEAINGQRTALKEKIATNNQEKQIDQELSRDYYVQNGFQFWPFEGEYWRDETGNYLNVGVNRCEK